MPDNVQLRPVADSDLPIFFEHQRDPLGVHMACLLYTSISRQATPVSRPYTPRPDIRS